MADGPDPTATGGAGDEPASADGELVGLSRVSLPPTSCMCGVGAVGELGQGVGDGAGSLRGRAGRVRPRVVFGVRVPSAMPDRKVR